MIPGTFLSIYVIFYTKKSEAPQGLLTFYSFVAFLMAIAWINWTSNCVVDLLKLFGFITGLPQALLSLTILAWGNSLGDMSADMAMTKKGFGEMGVTATMAGPIFNILVGQGISTTLTFLSHSSVKDPYISFSIFKSDGVTWNPSGTLPLTLILGEFGILVFLMFNALKNKFVLNFYISLMQAGLYLAFIIFLCVYSVVKDVQVGDG